MSAWLDRARESFAEEQAIKERNGLPPLTPEMFAADTVRMEMTDVGGLDIGRVMGELACSYVKTKNVYFMDQALLICADRKVQPSHTLLSYIVDAASRRMSGNPLHGATPAKVTLPLEKNHVLMLMANLIFHGATLREAASKAARYHNDRYQTSKTRKASSLESDYTTDFRNSGLEKNLFENWKRNKTAEINAQWDALRKTLKEGRTAEIGERR